MVNAPFKLDCPSYLPRYVSPQSYQTVLDDRSGHDHLLLAEKSRAYSGIQWGCWYFHYNTLLYGWKIFPLVYMSTGLEATNFFRSLGILCLLYIDDCHNGQLQEDINRVPYCQLQTVDERNLAAANSATVWFPTFWFRWLVHVYSVPSSGGTKLRLSRRFCYASVSPPLALRKRNSLFW